MTPQDMDIPEDRDITEEFMKLVGKIYLSEGELYLNEEPLEGENLKLFESAILCALNCYKHRFKLKKKD